MKQHYKNLQIELGHSYTMLDQLKKTPRYDTQTAETLRQIVDRARAVLDDRKNSLPRGVEIQVQHTPRPRPTPPPNSLRVTREQVRDVNAYQRFKEQAAQSGRDLWIDDNE